MTPAVGTTAWLMAELEAIRLFDRARLGPARHFLDDYPHGPATDFAQALIADGLLTPFQADRALAGEAKSLALGAYLIVDVIDEGGSGTTYRANGRADRQPYVVRVLPSRTQWQVRQARKQLRACADRPPIPGVISFLDLGTLGRQQYLAWPLVEGAPLHLVLAERGRVSPEVAVRIGSALAEALAALHAGGLVHGLLTPASVLLTATGVELADLGLGTVFSENENLADTAALADAIDYLAPEWLGKSAERTPAGDQYSLGAVLYFGLTGQSPLGELPFDRKLREYETIVPDALSKLNPAVPPELVAVIERLLQKSPGLRYGAMSEVAAALRDGATAKSSLPRRSSASGILGPAPPSTRGSSRSVPVYSPVPLEEATARPAPEARAQPPSAPAEDEPLPPSPSWTSRLFGFLKRGSSGPPEVAVYAPREVRAGQTFSIAVAVGPAGRLDRLDDLARRPGLERGGHGALSRAVPKGQALGVYLMLPGWTADKSLQTLPWNGSADLLQFEVRVPANQRPGEITGVVTVGRGGETLGQADFRLMVTDESA